MGLFELLKVGYICKFMNWVAVFFLLIWVFICDFVMKKLLKVAGVFGLLKVTFTDS